MSDNLSYLSGREGKGLERNLFEELVTQGKQDGTPEQLELRKLAKEYLMGDANMYGAASFYDFLKEANKGVKAYVCSGTACLTAGTQPEVQAELEKHYSKDEIAHMCCLGRCHENSAFHVGGVNYSGEAINQIADIAAGKEVDGMDDYNIGRNVDTPVLTGDFPGVTEYYALLRKVIRMDVAEVLKEIKESNVRGRGGAGFPMGFKLESCRNVPSPKKFIVCNADEGDPGAYTDRYLLEKQPHAVLFGMMVAGYVIGADAGVLYIRAEYPESITIIKNAIRELENIELLGKNIDGSGFNFTFKVIEAAGAYICGEETALLSSIEGQRPEVRIRPPYPTEKGLFNMPTVVNNVETLACLPFILEKGGAEFAKLGRGKSTGTKLVSLDSYFNKPGVYEIEMGTPLQTVIDEFGGGFKSNVKALQIGGPLGGVVPKSMFDKLTLDFESFAENQFLLGHASILSIPDDFPMIQLLEHLFEFTSDESCGKCFPCRLGAKRGQEMMEKAQEGSYKIDRELLNDLVETLEIGSLCALGGGVPIPIKNILHYFEDELKEYYG